MTTSALHFTPMPTKWVGPIKITGEVINEAVRVPLATYETPLWPSTDRGARVSRFCGTQNKSPRSTDNRNAKFQLKYIVQVTKIDWG